MSQFNIRFNHQHNGTGLVWRVFVDGDEHLFEHIQINVPVSDNTTLEHGVVKWNICCEGNLTVDGKTAIIS